MLTDLDRYYPVDPGYSMTSATRYIYAFLTADGRHVKIGLTHSVPRLLSRLREVTRRRKLDGLRKVAHIAIDNVDGHEAELIEAAIGLHLIRQGLLRAAGRVDWYEIVTEVRDEQWPDLLEGARQSVWPEP